MSSRPLALAARRAVATLVTTHLAAIATACVVLAVAAFAGGAVALAQDPPTEAPTDAPVVRAVVGATSLGEIPRHAISGVNLGNAMELVSGRDAVVRLRIETVRFPPGNQADEIRLGDADLAALAANLQLLGNPSVLMVANLFGGTPEQAADLARRVAAFDIEVAAWEIGNEPDLYASNRNRPSWTPERWCASFRAFGAAIREVDPDVPLAGPAVSGARPGGERFLREALRLCGDAIDVLSWHVYPTDGGWDDADALATARTVDREIARYRRWIADPARNPLGHEREIGLAVTEFGLSWRSASYRHLEDMTAALWLADVLGTMASERLDASHYFALQATGGHGLIDVGGWIRPTYHVAAMLADFVGEALPVTLETPDGPSALRAYAARHDGGLEVLLVNPGETDLAVALAPPSGHATTFDLSVLDDAIFDAANGPEARTATADVPFSVPARAVVHLRAGATSP